MKNQSKVRENIANLLEEVMERSLQINNPVGGDPLLDIDLVMEDLRQLYREYARLRKSIENNQPSLEGPVSEVVSAAGSPEFVQQADSGQPASEQGNNREEKASSHGPAQPQMQQPEEVPPRPEEFPPSPEEVPPHPQPEEVPPQPRPEEVPPQPIRQPEVPPAPEKSRQEFVAADPGMPGVIPAADPQPEQQPPQNPMTTAASIKPDTENGIQKTLPIKAQNVPLAQAAKPQAPKAIIDLFSEPVEKAIGDQFKSQENSLHQRISQNRNDSSIGTRMQQQPIANLREAIGVNDKFLFINELFHGNIQVYNEVVNNLNNFQDVQGAFNYLNELNQAHSWDHTRSAATIEKLANFVQRRYMNS